MVPLDEEGCIVMRRCRKEHENRCMKHMRNLLDGQS